MYNETSRAINKKAIQSDTLKNTVDKSGIVKKLSSNPQDIRKIRQKIEKYKS